MKEPRKERVVGARGNRFHAILGRILGAEPYRQAQGPLTCCLPRVGSDVLNRFRLGIALPSVKRAGQPWQRAGRWTYLSLQTTRKLIGGEMTCASAFAEALLAAYRTGTNPALTKGRAGGKLPSGNRADRSPAFRCSAASRNAATKRAYIR